MNDELHPHPSVRWAVYCHQGILWALFLRKEDAEDFARPYGYTVEPRT